MNFTLARAHNPKTGERFRLCRSRSFRTAVAQVLISGKSGWMSLRSIDLPAAEDAYLQPWDAPDWIAFKRSRGLADGYPKKGAQS